MTTISAKVAAAFDAYASGNRAAIPQDSNSATLLDYAALVTPDPLQVSAAGTIMLIVSNSSRQMVTCKSIVVTLSVGTNAKNLTESASALDVLPPDDWSADNQSGAITFTPNTTQAGQVGPSGLTFTISGFTVNAQVGTTSVSIDETAALGSQTPVDRSTSIGIPKFPAQFVVSDLQANPLDVPSGSTTTLNWVGPSTGPGGTAPSYTMTYQPANQGTPVSIAVGNTGPYQSQPLTRTGSVSFALVVSVKVPGQDTPLVVQRFATVAVDTLSAQITAVPANVGANGLVHLMWTSANAATCSIDPQIGAVATSGELYVTINRQRTFTLSAYDAAKNLVESQVTVTVDASIQPNQPGHIATGPNGGDGAMGQSDFDSPTNGGNGGDGGSVGYTGKIPPIDPSSSPAYVIPVSLIGGNGGNGGMGGSNEGCDPGPTGPGAAGGNGGRGGDATFVATLDASAGNPAQYTVVVSSGTGGGGGSGGDGTYSGPGGAHGAHGVLTATINGVAIIPIV